MLKIFLPFAFAKNVYEIDIDFYKKLGADTIICDLDNTLEAFYTPNPTEQALELIQKLKNSGLRVIIISNNRRKRVETYCKNLNCDFMYSTRKPLVYKGKKFMKKFNIVPEKTIYIGDQVFTDIVFANRLRLKSVLCDNLVERDQFFTKFNKFFDKFFRRKMKKKNLVPSWEEILHGINEQN